LKLLIGLLYFLQTGLASGVSMGVVVRKPAMTTKTVLADITRGTTSTTSAALDEEDRHEIAIETPPAHVGLMGLLFPWASGRGSPAGFSGQGGGLGVKLGMLNWPNIATFLALPRDRSQASNRVSIDSQGHPVLHYEVTPQDARLVLLGLEMNMRIIRAAGAKFLYFAHENFGWHQTERTSVEDNEEVRFEEYVRAMHREGIKTARMQIFSAHQMSSCRMAATPETGPTAPSGELFECAGLFVADGSALPTSLGINPMVTIEAVAHMVAGNIVRKIAAEHPQLEREMKAFRAANKRDW
jgi:choline dehydrogenase-like flavoprotein